MTKRIQMKFCVVEKGGGRYSISDSIILHCRAYSICTRHGSTFRRRGDVPSGGKGKRGGALMLRVVFRLHWGGPVEVCR